MRSFIRRKLAGLTGCQSGNATMIVAMGMPMLIGGAGMGVDFAQWYMWKRELQYAVDQAAIAGAWARVDEDTEATYVTRATQEFNANLAVVEGMTSTPAVGLANWSGGSNNSVTVNATATKELPFSSLILGGSTTVGASAQAVFEQGQTLTSCLLATDEDESGAITLGGSTVLTAACGLAAMSDSATAITVNGNPTIDAGMIMARGGIDDWLDENTDDVILEGVNVTNPFEDLEPPNPSESQVARTYSCAAVAGTTTADKSVTTTISYSYKKGSNLNNATAYTYSNPKAGSSNTTSSTGVLVPSGTSAGTTTSSSSSGTKISGSGQNSIWEIKTTSTSTTYSNVTVTGGTPQGTVVPGTYTDIHVSCDTTFSTGVYIIDGGGLKITGGYQVTGSSVMFVLKNGAWIDIAGGADITLTAIQASDLIARGVPADDANQLAGMLVFEDPNSEGSNKTKLNGNANTVLNGTIYLPVSNIDFSGTAAVTSSCLMVAAATITLTGNANMSTFCPPGLSNTETVVNTQATVRLVA